MFLSYCWFQQPICDIWDRKKLCYPHTLYSAVILLSYFHISEIWGFVLHIISKIEVISEIRMCTYPIYVCLWGWDQAATFVLLLCSAGLKYVLSSQNNLKTYFGCILPHDFIITQLLLDIKSWRFQGCYMPNHNIKNNNRLKFTILKYYI